MSELQVEIANLSNYTPPKILNSLYFKFHDFWPGSQVEDHNPPHLGQIFAFLERAGLFAAEDDEHVIAVPVCSQRVGGDICYLRVCSIIIMAWCIRDVFASWIATLDVLRNRLFYGS